MRQPVMDAAIGICIEIIDFSLCIVFNADRISEARMWSMIRYGSCTSSSRIM